MKLPETYSRHRSVSGFTLFELMLVMAMVIIIGVFIDEDSYVLFEGQDYLSRIIDQDVVFPINSNVTISGPSEIIFTELTGNANVSDNLYISLGTKEKQISILDTGYIDK